MSWRRCSAPPGWRPRGRAGPAADGARDAELAQLSWRLDFALTASEVGVWDVDLTTDKMIWDARAQALFGVSEPKRFYGEADWLAAIHPEDREGALAAAQAAIAADGRFALDYRVLLKDGRVRHVRDMAAIYRGRDGSHRLVGLVWDVTADLCRQQELELRRAEAEAATVAKSQLLAAMSHEIRTPMNGVLGMLDLILADALPDKQRERAAIARNSAGGLLRILNDILDLSKLEAQRIRVREESARPRQVVREVMDLMAAGAERKQLGLTTSVSDAVPEWIVTDPTRLRQVLTNIASNAIKFTDAGGVTVRVDHVPSESGGELVVEVEDTGIGVPPEMREEIFEKFVQVDGATDRRREGTGLGLAISRQLVELMGGRIAVRSAPGGGSIFRFTLSAPPSAPPAVPATPEASAVEPAGPSMRVLVAEDNATNQYLIRAHLEAAGHAVTTVENGAQAVGAVRTGAFDAVLMDVQMPEMDGPAAARAIRALPGPGGRLPIIALTANVPAAADEYLAAGMTDYVAKPIDAASLLRALRRAGAAAAPAAVATRRAG